MVLKNQYVRHNYVDGYRQKMFPDQVSKLYYLLQQFEVHL